MAGMLVGHGAGQEFVVVGHLGEPVVGEPLAENPEIDRGCIDGLGAGADEPGMSQPAVPGPSVRPEGPDELAVEHLPEAGEEPIPGRPVFVEEGPEIGDDHDPPIPDVAEQAAGSLLSGDDPDKRPASVKVETGWAS